MGGIGFEIPFEVLPNGAAELQLAVWNRIAQHVTGRLVGSKAGRSIIRNYAAMQASDGMDEAEGGDWFAGKSALFFFFGDAAGLCYLEQHATIHWATLATLDAWDEVAAIANEHGAKLGAPSKLVSDEETGDDARAVLKRLVSEKQHDVVFMLGSALAFARAEAAPAKDHQIFVQGKIKELGKLPAAERERVRGLLVEGRCHCEACQNVRANEGLPLVVEAGGPTKTANSAKAKGKAAPPAPPIGGPLETAAIVTTSDADALRGSGAVVLDLGIPWNAAKDVPRTVAPATFGILPSLPLRALSLKNRQLRALPPEVTACTGLEVLSLAGTRTVKLGKTLAELTALRAIEIDYNPRSTKTADFALLCTMPWLEVVDDVIWSGAIPAAFSTMTRLRSIEISPRGRCRLVEPLPLEAVTAHQAIPELGDKALRFYSGPLDGLPRDRSKLEMLAIDEPLPEKAMDLPRLRGLFVKKVGTLPGWIADLPMLEVLHVTEGEALEPKGLEVIDRLVRLRCLVIRGTALGEAHDFSRLESLAALFVLGKAGVMPKGLGGLPLRHVNYDTASFQKGIEPNAFRTTLPKECAFSTNDPPFTPWYGASVWFRAWCTDRSAPEWWLTRFRFGAAFEAMVDLAKR